MWLVFVEYGTSTWIDESHKRVVFNKGKTGFLESNIIGLSLLAHLQFKKNSRRQKEQRKKKNTDALLKEIFRIFFLHFSHSSWVLGE
jgi:hypothetical protein